MTDHDQCAFEEALRSDLNAARQQNLLLNDQLRDANAANEAMSYKVDFLVKEVARVTASREQYERVAIRVATFAESVAAVAIKQLQDLQDEIKDAAFAKVPGAVQNEPAAASEPEKPVIGIPMSENIDAEQIGRNFGAGFEGSASLLPPAQIGNGVSSFEIQALKPNPSH